MTGNISSFTEQCYQLCRRLGVNLVTTLWHHQLHLSNRISASCPVWPCVAKTWHECGESDRADWILLEFIYCCKFICTRVLRLELINVKLFNRFKVRVSEPSNTLQDCVHSSAHSRCCHWRTVSVSDVFSNTLKMFIGLLLLMFRVLNFQFDLINPEQDVLIWP